MPTERRFGKRVVNAIGGSDGDKVDDPENAAEGKVAGRFDVKVQKKFGATFQAGSRRPSDDGNRTTVTG